MLIPCHSHASIPTLLHSPWQTLKIFSVNNNHHRCCHGKLYPPGFTRRVPKNVLVSWVYPQDLLAFLVASQCGDKSLCYGSHSNCCSKLQQGSVFKRTLFYPLKWLPFSISCLIPPAMNALTIDNRIPLNKLIMKSLVHKHYDKTVSSQFSQWQVCFSLHLND